MLKKLLLHNPVSGPVLLAPGLGPRARWSRTASPRARSQGSVPGLGGRSWVWLAVIVVVM